MPVSEGAAPDPGSKVLSFLRDNPHTFLGPRPWTDFSFGFGAQEGHGSYNLDV